MNRILFFSSFALLFVSLVLGLNLYRYRQKYRRYRSIARALERLVDEESPPGLEKLLGQIRKECGDGSSTSAISMAVCSYVHSNCSLEGEEDVPDYKDAVAKIAEGGKPFALCGARARMMKELCSQMGVVARIAHAFNLKNKEILSHSFVETYNPSDGEWELYDPYFNVYAVSAEGKHCGIICSLKDGFSMRFCSPTGQNINWINGKFSDYSDAVILESTDSRVGIRDPVVLFHSKQDCPAAFGNWCEKHYGTPTFLELRN